MNKFNKDGFMEHLLENFDDMKSHFVYDMAENIVDLAIRTYCTNAMCEFISDMIPEVTFDEVDKFYKWNGGC